MLFQLNVLTKFFTSKLCLCLPKVGHMIKSCKEPIRKQISPLRNLSSWWISFEKSKSRFHGFPFHHSIGKSEKWFAKLFSWKVVFFLLFMWVCARPLFLRTVFQILFSDFQKKRKERQSKNRYLRVENCLRILCLIANLKSGF